MIATVTTKGQVTIPKSIRDEMGIRPNDKVDFTLENGRVILKPMKTLLDFRGSVPASPGATIEAERKAYRNRARSRKPAAGTKKESSP